MDAPEPETEAAVDGAPADASDVAVETDGLEMPEVVDEAPAEDDEQQPAIREPARVMRIGAMIRQLRDEVHEAPLDEASRERLREIYETSVRELSSALSPDPSRLEGCTATHWGVMSVLPIWSSFDPT